MAYAPFGWAVVEPGKLSGSLALAFLPGIALAPVMLSRHAPRRFPIVGTLQTVAIGAGLLVYMLPGLNWALLDEKASNVPERFPPSIRTAPAELDRRNADWKSRTFLAILPSSRHPEWSAHQRVLHFVEKLSFTSPIVIRVTVLGAELRELMRSDSPALVATLRSNSIARVMVPLGTPDGRALADQLQRTEGLELDFAEGYYKVFRTVDPPYPWVYEVAPDGPVELSWRREGMDRLVIDVPRGPQAAREIVVQEFWDPLWTAHLPNHAASVERSTLGLMTVQLEPGAHGRLILEFGLQHALVAGHALTWAGLVGWAGWTLWPRRPWRSRAHP